MAELLTSDQMRAIEQAAMARGEVTGLELMERAGRGVVKAIFKEWPDLAQTAHHAVVLCGPGNNGGDGFVVARLLKEWGWTVEVFLYGDPTRLPPDAKTNHDRWFKTGEVGDLLADFDTRKTWQGADLAIDALFGTGLTRPLEDLTQVLMNLEDAADIHDDPDTRDAPHFDVPRVVAIDIPSGLDADSGKLLVPAHLGSGCAAANLTVSFHALKLGHVLHDGPLMCGKTVVADIGLDHSGDDAPGQVVQGVTKPRADHLAKNADAHKYAHGHALMLSGPSGKGGAARLAARGALRIGAGLVSVLCEEAAIAEHAAQLTAIMIKPVSGAEDLEALLEDERLNAMCLGPGLGTDDKAADLVAAALGCRAEARPTGQNARACVLDADALTILARRPDLVPALHDRCVLTPHAGEFKRLFPDLAEKLGAVPTTGPAYSKVDATREAAKRAGCSVLFKGPDTVIASPDGRASINSAHYDRAAPWLATAGSGDVLAGFITGLLARGFEPHQAAETAAWLHVECALSFGPGLIAEDLPEELPKVFRTLGL
ncbi:bifunctional ADP-dependent NAD(P)H-hydrate dehydratase/NAD(P)H-hydrate epimerase [Aestuariivita boseongensis]|uniref:bifunctional ADP-dependent NAD(P)H-hydrate dehydratase/NAD(P)H-hydrate epimerase n=1 Tax=Aestuariivita boseongensis TaxID=1470562 RepID=UPI00067F9DAF|nr:bifunctional ADP-dependent NAD(P)H-hydrate dehydratase/NAD(P)H-hydrate epimerase [Aestuariivita boseongensis]